MPGPYATFDRSTSDVPGSGAGAYYFASHPSGLCTLHVWRPSASFQDAPCFVVYVAGTWAGYGDASMALASIDADLAAIAVNLNAAGWAIVVVEVPPGPDTERPSGEAVPFAYFPEQELLAGAAVAHLKAHASGIDDASSSARGVTLWGAGNSVSPNRIVTAGAESGATTALLLALIPGQLFPHLTGRLGLTVDPLVPLFDHRPRACVAFGATADFTQFDVDSGGSGLLANDRHPHFTRTAGSSGWAAFPRRVKLAASPYHWLLAGHPENLAMPLYASWPHDADSDGSALIPADFEPGNVLDDAGSNKAYRSPTHHFVGQSFNAAAIAKASPLSVVRWGNSSDNPTLPALTGATLQAAVQDWLEDDVVV